jgi:hypothetical protein
MPCGIRLKRLICVSGDDSRNWDAPLGITGGHPAVMASRHGSCMCQGLLVLVVLVVLVVIVVLVVLVVIEHVNGATERHDVVKRRRRTEFFG